MLILYVDTVCAWILYVDTVCEHCMLILYMWILYVHGYCMLILYFDTVCCRVQVNILHNLLLLLHVVLCQDPTQERRGSGDI